MYMNVLQNNDQRKHKNNLCFLLQVFWFILCSQMWSSAAEKKNFGMIYFSLVFHIFTPSLFWRFFFLWVCVCVMFHRLSRCTLHRKTGPTEQTGVGGDEWRKEGGENGLHRSYKRVSVFFPTVLRRDRSSDGGGKKDRGPSVTLSSYSL